MKLWPYHTCLLACWMAGAKRRARSPYRAGLPLREQLVQHQRYVVSIGDVCQQRSAHLVKHLVSPRIIQPVADPQCSQLADLVEV